MAELASHVLMAFVLFTMVGWRVDWLDREWVVVAMVGSLLPDLNRVNIVIEGDMIEAVLGIPWGWSAIHTIGGVLILSAIGCVLFARRRAQYRAFGLLVGGAVLHLLTDGVKAWANGYNGMYLYPFSTWRNPTPGWYVSADRWVLVLWVLVALVVLVVDRMIRDRQEVDTDPV